MSRSSGCRAQVEPLAALVAVAMLGLALATYGVAHSAVTPPASERDRSAPALDRVHEALRTGGVVRPDRLDGLPAPPAGHGRRIRLAATDRIWTSGPAPPANSSVATRIVAIRLGDGRVRMGRLRVEVWTR